MSKKRIDLRKRKQHRKPIQQDRAPDRCPACQERLYSYSGGVYCGKCGWSREVEDDGR
jgi:hypothetical protein